MKSFLLLMLSMLLVPAISHAKLSKKEKRYLQRQVKVYNLVAKKNTLGPALNMVDKELNIPKGTFSPLTLKKGALHIKGIKHPLVVENLKKGHFRLKGELINISKMSSGLSLFGKIEKILATKRVEIPLLFSKAYAQDEPEPEEISAAAQIFAAGTMSYCAFSADSSCTGNLGGWVAVAGILALNKDQESLSPEDVGQAIAQRPDHVLFAKAANYLAGKGKEFLNFFKTPKVVTCENNKAQVMSRMGPIGPPLTVTGAMGGADAASYKVLDDMCKNGQDKQIDLASRLANESKEIKIDAPILTTPVESDE